MTAASRLWAAAVVLATAGGASAQVVGPGPAVRYGDAFNPGPGYNPYAGTQLNPYLGRFVPGVQSSGVGGGYNGTFYLPPAVSSIAPPIGLSAFGLNPVTGITTPGFGAYNPLAGTQYSGFGAYNPLTGRFNAGLPAVSPYTANPYGPTRNLTPAYLGGSTPARTPFAR